MPAWVALLRGINVGGKHPLSMDKVRAACEQIGGTKVATYIQSGNVVLAHPQRYQKRFAELLSAALTETAGFTVPVVARTAEQFHASIASSPFTDPEVLHCAFMRYGKPTSDQYGMLHAIDLDLHLPSKFELAGGQIFFHLPDGVGRDKLVPKVLRVFPDATTRNWRTVLKLKEMIELL